MCGRVIIRKANHMHRFEKIRFHTLCDELSYAVLRFQSSKRLKLTSYFSLGQISYKHWGEPIIMPRSKNKSKEVKKSNESTTQQTKWVNIHLTDDDSRNILDRYNSDDIIFAELGEYFDSGRDLSVSYRIKQDNYACYLSFNHDSDVSYRYKIASYAQSAQFAIAVALFKFDKFKGSPNEYITNGESASFG